MLEWCPRKHKYKADGNDKDSPGLENGVKKGISNIEEDLSFNEDEAETPNTLTRKVKG